MQCIPEGLYNSYIFYTCNSGGCVERNYNRNILGTLVVGLSGFWSLVNVQQPQLAPARDGKGCLPHGGNEPIMLLSNG